LNNKYNIIDLFSGCGGFSQGFLKAGFNIIAANEFWDPAMETYKFNHENVNTLDGDITLQETKQKLFQAVNGKKVNVIIGGPPCFIEDTPIITKNGYKKIQDIILGDKVLTHTGYYRKVINLGNKIFSGNLITIKLKGHNEIYTCTDNHPIFIREYQTKNNSKNRTNRKTLIFENYLRADQIKPDIHYVCIPTSIENSLPNIKYQYAINQSKTIDATVELPFNDCDFWFLMGFYLAEGWYRKDLRQSTKILKNCKRSTAMRRRYTTIISANDNEMAFIKKKLEKFFNVNVSKERTANKLYISDKNLWHFVKQFGKASHEKKLPEFIHKLPKPFLKAFIEGWVKGDGYITKIHGVKRIRIATTSPKLAIDCVRAIAKAYNVHATVVKIKVSKTKMIKGRLVNQREWYQISFRPAPKRKLNWVLDEKKKLVWVKIDKIIKNKVNSKRVFDIEVEKDHTYCTPLFVSHNCQGYSVAGNRNPADPRGQLYLDYIEIINKLKPDFFVMENVKGLLHMKHVNPSLNKDELMSFKKNCEKLQRFKDLKRYGAQRELDVEENNEFKNLKKSYKEIKKKIDSGLVPLINKILNQFKRINYKVAWKVLNAADYGIPQTRERIIFIGTKHKNVKLSFPIKTHYKNYINNHVTNKDIIGNPVTIRKKPWNTSDSVLKFYEDWEEDVVKSHLFTKHKDSFVERLKKTPIGGNVYENYSDAWWRLDPNKPARTVKENHGGVFVHYKYDRVCTPRELAALQSFDDNFIFKGTKSSILKQIGNAIPPLMSKAIAEQIKILLDGIYK